MMSERYRKIPVLSLVLLFFMLCFSIIFYCFSFLGVFFNSATCVVYVISVLESFKTKVARDYKLSSVCDLFSAFISRRILSKSQQSPRVSDHR